MWSGFYMINADTGTCGGEQINTRAAAPVPTTEKKKKQSISPSEVKVGL